MNAMQPPDSDPAANSAPAEPESVKLVERQNTVLVGGQASDLRFDPVVGGFRPVFRRNPPTVRHRPMVAGVVALIARGT